MKKRPEPLKDFLDLLFDPVMWLCFALVCLWGFGFLFGSSGLPNKKKGRNLLAHDLN